jgi:hypothetical protein
MDLEEELRNLKAQIHEIEEKIRYTNNEEQFDYEANLIDKVYEICQDEHETFLAKVMEICSLDNHSMNSTVKLHSIIDANSAIIQRSQQENQVPVLVPQTPNDIYLPKIIDYSVISEVEDTFMEVRTFIIYY